LLYTYLPEVVLLNALFLVVPGPIEAPLLASALRG
jgi:hypothetical protein